jgi:hypothetical protein
MGGVTLKQNFNKMADYKCEVCGDVVEKTGVTIRYIAGKGAIHDVQCEECGEYMELANPKSGVPSFRSNRYGQTY